MEDRWGLAWIIYDDIVYVIIVDDVGDVATLRLGLKLFLGVARGSTTAHSETLTIRISGAFKSTIILRLLSHGILGELLGTSERSLLIITITVDKVVVFLCTLRSARLLSIIRAENTSLAVPHITLAS